MRLPAARWPLLALLVLMIVGALLVMDSAYAQDRPQDVAAGLRNASGQMDVMLQAIKRSSVTWTDTLRKYAINLFWLLAGIQFIWTFFPLVFRQADFSDLVSELVRFILVIGFFAALLTYSHIWTKTIIESFEILGYETLLRGPHGDLKLMIGDDGRIGLNPGNVFGVAVEIANMISQTSVNATDATQGGMLGQMLPLAGLTIMMCFVFIAAFMAMTLIESWIVINVSVLFMGLGGSEWTRHYARQMLTYAFSVGVKMFVMTLIVGLILSTVAGWRELYEAEKNSVVAVWTTVGLAMISAFFAKAIPELAQSLISGAASSGGSAAGAEGAGMTAASGRMTGTWGMGGLRPMDGVWQGGGNGGLTSPPAPELGANPASDIATGGNGLNTADGSGARISGIGGRDIVSDGAGDKTTISATGSGTTESGATESGTTENGTTESGATGSGTTGSGTTGSGTTGSGTTESGATGSGTTESGATGSGTTESGATGSGATGSGATGSGTTGSGTTGNDTTRSGTAGADSQVRGNRLQKTSMMTTLNVPGMTINTHKSP